MRGSRASCASASFSVAGASVARAALLLACATATACGRTDGTAHADRTSVAPADRGEAGDVPSVALTDGPPEEEPIAAKSIGHTSYVLKVTLADGTRGAFKPRSKRPLGDRRYRGEIAAYRLAQALGLDNVPRAAPREFALASLRAACRSTPGGVGTFDREALVDPNGTIRGAFIEWIDDYRVLPLEESAWRARWEGWLIGPSARMTVEERPLASAISTMLAFDYMTANWDRFSGGNVAQHGKTGPILFVDNDGAFFEVPPPDAIARQLALVRRVLRFSRRFVSAVRVLDETRLREIFGEESPGEPLLPRNVVAAVDTRRRQLIEAIDARVRGAGEQATFPFE
jgi:hypothetical protein